MKTFLEDLEKYPPRFGHQTVAELFPGIVSSKQLANLASRGEGPPYLVVRRRVTYERESFLRWLDEQAR